MEGEKRRNEPRSADDLALQLAMNGMARDHAVVRIYHH